MPRPPSNTRQLIDPMAAFQMVHIMEGVVERGTATVLRDLNRPLFGKTGTTSGPTNVWFVGGTPDIVAGVYMGYDQPRSMGGYAQGGRIAAPIFKQWAKIALLDQPKTPFTAPAGIRWLRIDRKPLSTERPGPTRVTPPRPAGTFPRRCAGLSLAPSGGAPVRHTVPDPAALRLVRRSSPVGRPVVDSAEPTGPGPPPVNSRLTCEFSPNSLVSAEDAQVARRGGAR